MNQTPLRIPHEIWVLVSAAFLIALGYGFISPILPQFATSFGVGAAAAGAVVSVFAGARLVFAPTSGTLVDKLGARWVYISGLLLVATTTGMVAAAQEYWHIIVLRGLAGFGSTMFTVSATGLIVRLAPPAIRGRCSSAYASGFLFGSVLGPAIGSALSVLGFWWPFIIYGVFLGGAALVVWWRMPKTVDAKATGADTRPVLRFGQALKDSAYRAILTTSFANGFVNFGVRVSILPLFVYATFDNGGVAAGIILSASAAGNAAALQFSGRLTDQIGRKIPIRLGFIIAAIFTGGMGMVENIWVLVVFAVCVGIGTGIENPALQASLADVIGNDRNGGKALAAFQMAGDLGAILGPITIGMIAQTYGYAIAFIVTAVVLAIAVAAWQVARETWVRAEATT